MPAPRPACQPRARGFSLIELLLVLGVLAILLVAMFVVYPRVKMGNQINREMTRLHQIRAAIDSAFRGQGMNIAGSGAAQSAVMDSILITADVIPAGQTSLSNEWGGVIRVYPITGQIGSSFPCSRDRRALLLRYENIPAEACTKLVSKMLGDLTRYCYLSVDGAPQILWADGYTATEPTVGSVASACETQGQATGRVGIRVGMR